MEIKVVLGVEEHYRLTQLVEADTEQEAIESVIKEADIARPGVLIRVEEARPLRPAEKHDEERLLQMKDLEKRV